MGGTTFNIGPRCYNCGSNSHLIRHCPYLLKGQYAETPGKNNSSFGNISVDEKKKGDNSILLHVNQSLNSKLMEILVVS